MEASIRNYVLSAIANDYEEFEMVFGEVAKWAEEDGKIGVAREEIIGELERLINEGYAQAYLLSPQDPHAEPVTFSADNIGDLWFYVTPKGKRLVNEFQTWGRKGE